MSNRPLFRVVKLTYLDDEPTYVLADTVTQDDDTLSVKLLYGFDSDDALGVKEILLQALADLDEYPDAIELDAAEVDDIDTVDVITQFDYLDDGTVH